VTALLLAHFSPGIACRFRVVIPSAAIVFGLRRVISDPDILRAAQLLIQRHGDDAMQRHGDDAAIRTARRADELKMRATWALASSGAILSRLSRSYNAAGGMMNR
jgi:hypothetical protein